ncbi:MAG TPA: UDP-N-acetylmuramoyl-tripeptide--D-alanyl-D-alanine ligase [Candidatus Paceibacterota bacterium]|nr:UDP-N-acetylmuramoyl-tripeptide--D-alanyl-D-alanine ligase [Candidatus Paceibacterota bacterium]
MKEIIKRIIIRILTLEARAVLARYKPTVIAVTGNLGKTSAKEAIFAALATAYHVRKSEKSLNSDIGVPLAILGRESGWNDPLKWLGNIVEGLLLAVIPSDYPKWLVLEVGADRPGDIKSLASWLAPDIAVITGIPDVPVHIEFFSSVEELAAEKRELAAALKPHGKLVVNGDDARASAIGDEFRAQAARYGFGKENEVAVSHFGFAMEKGRITGIHFRVNADGSSLPITVTGVLGRAYAYPILAAAAVARAAGLDLITAMQAFEEYRPIAGRMRLLPGAAGAQLIDDTYNASPAATAAALEALAEAKADGRKIAVLGDMLELGKHSVEEHRKIGRLAAQSVDLLVTVGIRARGIALSAIEAGLPEARVKQYEHEESARAGEELRPVLAEGDLVLIKGSQGLRMEKATAALLEEPADAPSLLVRQDAAWQER